MEAKVGAEDFILWKNSPITKILLLQLEIDLEQMTDNWVNGHYSERDVEAVERGKANYNLAVVDVIKSMGISYD